MFIAVSSILYVVAYLIYTKSILKGETKPHRTTRLVILVITALATLALFAQGDRVAVWLAGVSAVFCIVIFILSLKHGMGGRSKTDILCLVLAVIGIVLWQTTKMPIIALFFSIGADFIGMVPTLIKTYHLPKTEIWQSFAFATLAGFFSMLALNSWTIGEFSYPLYIMLINIIMVILIIRPNFSKKKV